jgi:hypothetical protein
MAEYIDALLQDAQVLKGVAETHATKLAEAGVTADTITELTTLTTTMKDKVGEVAGMEKDIGTKTREQNTALKKAEKHIKKIRTAAKGVFKKEKGILKEFHIGKDIPKTVKAMTTELQYMKQSAVKYKDRLSKKIKDADIEALTQCETEVVATDKAQEELKKATVTARASRDRAAKDLKDMLDDIRNSAAIAFADDKDTLKEFKSIIRTSKKKSEPTTPPPTS